MLQQISELIEDAMVPGKYLVELFHALQYLPEWFPGAGFKKDASVVREKVIDTRRTLYEEGRSLLVRVLTIGRPELPTSTDSTVCVPHQHTKPTGDTMLALMLQRITALEGDAAAEEEEHSTGALMETYVGEPSFPYLVGPVRTKEC